MARFLSPEERKYRRQQARRWVGIVLLLFIVSIGGSIIYQSSRENTDETILSEKHHSFNFRYEFRRLDNDKKVELYIDGQLFTAYCYADYLKKPILFPVSLASGKIITRGYPLNPRPFEPTDHPHHMGIWFTFGNVNNTDFWSNSDSIPQDRKFHYGTIRHRSFNKIKSGDESGVLEVECSWERFDERVLLDEETKFVFSGEPHIKIIDRITTLSSRETSIQFEDSKEGMYCIRVARELEQPSDESRQFLDENLNPVAEPMVSKTKVNGLYDNSEGITGDSVWGKRAKWVRLSSLMNGDPVSVIMFDHPSNPNYPAYWMARGYGLFGVNPLGAKDYTEGKESLNYFLNANSSVHFKYRMVIIEGIRLTREEIEKMSAKFINE